MFAFFFFKLMFVAESLRYSWDNSASVSLNFIFYGVFPLANGKISVYKKIEMTTFQKDGPFHL